jgi:hypothetical protein
MWQRKALANFRRLLLFSGRGFMRESISLQSPAEVAGSENGKLYFWRGIFLGVAKSELSAGMWSMTSITEARPASAYPRAVAE